MSLTRAFRDGVDLPFEWRIRGYDVVDSQEKLVASVYDVICDVESGSACYVMVEIGGMLGISGRKVLLPTAMLVRAGSGQMVAGVTLERIMDSPAIENSENPTRDEEKKIFDYYNLQPYWAGDGGKDSTEVEDEKEDSADS